MYEVPFIDACLEGDVLPDEIDDYIDWWHENKTGKPIFTFLGMNEDEYALWVENDSFLKHILFARKQGLNVHDFIGWDEGRKLAARAASAEEAERILAWLKRTGRL